MTKAKKKFSQEPKSIDSMLHKLPKKLRDRYNRNRRKSEIDAVAMERWAERGFSSGDGTVHSPDEDMLG